jgi:cell division protein FtsL
VGNLAEKIHKKQQEVRTQTVTRAIRITLGEKFLFGLLLCGIVIGSISMISNNSELYEVNDENAKIEAEIKSREKVNKELKTAVEDLTRYERVIEASKKQGLNFDPNNIKKIE